MSAPISISPAFPRTGNLPSVGLHLVLVVHGAVLLDGAIVVKADTVVLQITCRLWLLSLASPDGRSGKFLPDLGTPACDRFHQTVPCLP